MKDMYDNEITSFLESELERVDKWLSFGETKNAAIIAFNIAVLAVDFKFDFAMLFTLTRVLLVIAILLSLISFFPNLARKASYIDDRLKKKNIKSKRLNAIYFDDISRCEKGSDYLKLLGTRYYQEKMDETNKLYSDFAEEIVINSKITSTKYTCFKYSVRVDVLAMILMIVLFIFA